MTTTPSGAAHRTRTTRPRKANECRLGEAFFDDPRTTLLRSVAHSSFLQTPAYQLLAVARVQASVRQRQVGAARPLEHRRPGLLHVLVAARLRQDQVAALAEDDQPLAHRD